MITVNGSGFLPNEAISLYWDQSTRVSGATNADRTGNFTTKVRAFPGDAPGVHRLCASAPPSPCANFTLQAPTPTPSPDASPSPEPSPSPTPVGVASPARIAERLNGLDLMLKPPFVILPIIGGVGLAIALIYWVLSVVLRPRPQLLKSVTVGHLASRPDYSAGFGTPPPAPAPAPSLPSAWPDQPQPSPAVEMGAEDTAQEAPPAGNGAEAPLENILGDDPLLLAWADVLPPSTPASEAAQSEAAEGPPNDETKPQVSHDEPPDFPEPGD